MSKKRSRKKTSGSSESPKNNNSRKKKPATTKAVPKKPAAEPWTPSDPLPQSDGRRPKRTFAVLEQRVNERTAQVQQQARELVEKQGLLEAMLHSTTEAVIVIDKDHRYLIVNSAAEELFDFRLNDRSSPRWPQHYGEAMTPEMIRCPIDQLPAARALRGEVVRDAELLVRNKKHRDGLWIRFNSDPLQNEAGEIVGAVSIAHDVTVQRRLARDRARLDAIMRDTSASIWISSLDGTVRAWNKGAEHLLGYTAEEIVGRNISAIFPPERRDEFGRLKERLLRNPAAEAEETVHLHKDGSRVDLALTASLVDTGDDIEGLCVVAHDIGERKRVEHKIAALAESERQRIGHELHDSLGQQLTAIGIIVTALKSQLSKNSPQNTTMGKLESLVDETKAQLRAVARGLVPVDLDACGLRVALSNLMTEVRQVPDVDCRLECPDAISLPDSFTATQLYLIAREAVYNALKHSKARTIVVRVEDGKGLRLSVRDNGVGIDSHVKSQGGMGLHLMRHRSGLIGATFCIERADGSGTLVTCGVPQRGTKKDRDERGGTPA